MPGALETRLRLHAHELVTGGANASQLRADLVAAADRLEVLEETAIAITGRIVDVEELLDAAFARASDGEGRSAD